MKRPILAPLYLALLTALGAPSSQATDLDWVDSAVSSVNQQVIDLRRTIHQHPELGNQEVKTAALVAAQLKGSNIEVRTQVGKTGVVGVLKGGLRRPTCLSPARPPVCGWARPCR